MAGSRILVAVSSPWASEKLSPVIRDLARLYRAAVIVAHVARPTEQDDTPDDTRLRAEQTLSTLTEQLVQEGINAESLMLYGHDVARAVLNAAEAREVTLLVISRSARSRMFRWLAGDVPRQIIRRAKVPVLVFPPDWSGSV